MAAIASAFVDESLFWAATGDNGNAQIAIVTTNLPSVLTILESLSDLVLPAIFANLSCRYVAGIAFWGIASGPTPCAATAATGAVSR